MKVCKYASMQICKFGIKSESKAVNFVTYQTKYLSQKLLLQKCFNLVYHLGKMKVKPSICQKAVMFSLKLNKKIVFQS